MRSFIKQKYELIALVVLNILVYSPWFFTTKFITYSDFSVWLQPTQKELLANSFLIYRANSGFGNIALGATYNLMEFMYGLFANAGLDYRISIRLLLLWPIVILTPIFAYKLALKVLKSRIGAVISTLVVLFNSYSLILIQGGSLIAIGNTFSIIFIYYLFSFFTGFSDAKHHLHDSLNGKVLPEGRVLTEGYKRKDFIKLLITCLFFGIFEFRIFYIGAWIGSIFILYWFILFGKNLREKVRALTSWVGILVLVMLMNLYWIIPFYLTKTLTSNEAFSRGLFGNSYFDLSSALTLFHKFWSGTVIKPFFSQPIPFYFWIIPVVAFAGLYVNRKNKAVLFFGLISLIGVFLTKMTSAPFEGTYQWLFDYLPGFRAFREASKFYMVVALGYSILIGSLVAWVWNQNLKNKLQTVGKYTLTLLIAGIFLFNTKPFFTKEIGTLLIPKNIPSDYLILNDFLEKDGEFFRTYWMPTGSRWGVYTDNHPKIHGSDAASVYWKHFLTGNTLEGKLLREITLDLLQHNYSNDLFDSASVKYLVVPLRDTANDDDFYIYFEGATNEFFIQEMDKIDFLKRLDIGTKEIVVYENPNFKPPITVSDRLASLENLENLDDKFFSIKNTSNEFNFVLAKSTSQKINRALSSTASLEKPKEMSFELVNPTKKLVHIKGAAKPFFLNTNTTYNQGWQLRFTDKKDNRVSDEEHYNLNDIYNGWYVDVDAYCGVAQLCKKNADGSYDIEMTIEFWPQRLYNLGLLLTWLTALSTASVLAWLTLKESRKK